MTGPNRRYVGVAKVPSPAPGPAAAAPTAAYAAVPPVPAQPGRLPPVPMVHPIPPPPHRAPTRPAPLAAARARARRVKGLRPATLRRFEATAWVAAVGVMVALAAFLIARPSSAAQWIAAPPAGADDPYAAPVVPLYPSASVGPCIFDACEGSGPTGPPTRIRIPAIGVDSGLESLTLDSQRHLGAPTNVGEAGWYAGGIAPGDPGPAVIAGHVDSYRGPGVFFKLVTLVPGAVVEIERGGVWLTFRVTRVEQYAKNRFPTSTVYSPTPDAQLRVITCGGDFDNRALSYRDNIVVYATEQ